MWHLGRMGYIRPMTRVVRPEILDSLPGDHPDARASRRDLRRINWLMGNDRWMHDRLRVVPRPFRVLELGAGEGELARKLFSGQEDGVEWCGIDFQPRPEAWPAGWNWVEGDLLEVGWPEADLLVASLVLHHFREDALRLMAQKIPDSVQRILICEPARRAVHKIQLALLGVLGINRVTWHDGRVSIDAGFLPGELETLWQDAAGSWRWTVTVDWRGALRLEGVRS